MGNPKVRILAFLVLSIGLVLAIPLLIPTPLSDSDIQRITALVQMETSEPILNIRA